MLLYPLFALVCIDLKKVTQRCPYQHKYQAVQLTPQIGGSLHPHFEGSSSTAINVSIQYLGLRTSSAFTCFISFKTKQA